MNHPTAPLVASRALAAQGNPTGHLLKFAILVNTHGFVWTVVAPSADFEITVTMALAVLVSCAESGGRTPNIEQQTPTTIATCK